MCPAKQGKIEDTEAFINPVKANPKTDEVENAKTDYV